MAIQIKELRAKRAELAAQMKAIIAKDTGDGLSDDDVTAFDALKGQVDAHDQRIGRLETMNEIEADGAVGADDEKAVKSDDDDDEDEKAEKAIRFSNVKSFTTRSGRVFAEAKSAEPDAARCGLMAIIAKAYDDVPVTQDKRFKSGRDMLLATCGPSAVTKALAATAGVPNGGALIVQEFLPQLITLLRARTVMRGLALRKVSLVGSLTIPRQTATGMAAWQGELDEIIVSNPTLDDILLTPKKLTAMSTVTNDLIRRSPIDALNFVEQDLTNRVARYEDIALIRGTGTNGQPLGLLSLAQTQITYTVSTGLTPITDYQGVLSFLSQLQNQLETANVEPTNPVWLMHPSTKNFLKAMRNEFGVSYFPEVQGDMLLGAPVLTTTQIPANLTTNGRGSEIYYFDAPRFILADAMGAQMEVSRDATFRDPTSGQLVSAFASDMTVVRFIEEMDTNIEHPEAAVVGLVNGWFPYG